MDERVASILDFFATPPPPDLRRIKGTSTRERWAATSDILNRDAPERPVERGRVIAERGGEPLRVDLYPADGEGPHAGVLYIHGGSWVGGSPLTHDKLVKRFAERGFAVASVDYALAPEHPFPTALDDCVTSADWLASAAADLGIDATRLAIMGDSAGGNLAAATLHRLLERDGATVFNAAALLYGVYDFPAMLKLPEDSPFVTGRIFRWQVEDYLGPAADSALLTSPGVSPRFSPHLQAYPPTFLTVGTQDPLLQQSLDFQQALTDAGVTAEALTFEGATHAFLQIEETPAAMQGIEAIAAFLRQTLDG